MAAPASFRLPRELLDRVGEEARERSTSVTALVATLLDEGLKIRRFPGIVYRDGPAGRRAAIAGGPDVWELIAALQQGTGRGEQRLRRVAQDRALQLAHLRLALDFYAEHSEEVDARIAADQQVAERVRRQVEKRERLLAR